MPIADRDRVQRQDAEALEQAAPLGRHEERDAERDHGDRRDRGEPADLVAPDVVGTAVAQHERRDRQREERERGDRLDGVGQVEERIEASM